MDDKTKGKYHAAQSFPDWNTYVEFVREGTSPDVSWDVSWGGSDAWAGCRNLGHALEIAGQGWAAGMDRVRSIALPAVNALSTAAAPVEDWVWDVTGSDFDVGSYLSGTPECWLSCQPSSDRPVVTIMANITVSAGVPARCMEMRGAAVVALTMALQGAGYAVRVYSCQGFPVNRWEAEHGTFTRVLLTDDAGGPLDTDRLLYALAHPSASRSLSFVAACKVSGIERPTGNESLAQPLDPPASLGWDCDLYLPKTYVDAAEWQDAASVAKWVADTYAKLTSGVQTPR